MHLLADGGEDIIGVARAVNENRRGRYKYVTPSLTSCPLTWQMELRVHLLTSSTCTHVHVTLLVSAPHNFGTNNTFSV